MKRNPLAVAIICAGFSFGGEYVQAQDRQLSGAQRILEEVVITARRREEALQDAPIAVSAFTGESLDYRSVSRLDDITSFVPSLTLENNPSFGGASNSAAIYLRGIGQKEFLPTTEPGVGLYVDGVYVARSVGALLDIVDIEQLEILRGPQGTLFGRNTIGGAVSINTVKPDPNGERETSFSVMGGSDDLLNLRGSFHFPISDTLAARISLASFEQDGYVKRADGVDLGDDDTDTGRLSLAWRPNDRLSADFSFEATRDRENGPALELIGIDFTDLSQLGGVVLAPPPPMAFIHNVTAAAAGQGIPCAVTDTAGNGITSNPAISNCYDSRYIGKDGHDDGTAPAFSETDLRASSATFSYDLSDNLTLKSISAWRDLDSEFARDGDHSPSRISQFLDYLDQEQFTQEIQLLGSYQNLDWILGYYYFTEDGRNTNILDFTVSNFRSGGDFDNEASAVFAQMTYDLADNLHLTLGGRYTDEEKEFLPDQIIFNNYYAGISQVVPPGHPLAALDAPFMQAGSRILPYMDKKIDISEFTPMASLSYDFSDEVMVYGAYSEGFKSGGFTQRVFPPVVAGFTAPPGTADIDLIPTYDPEFVESYEVGFKARLADGLVRLNGAIYHTDYDDLQVQVFNSVAPVTENIGEANIEGIELEVQAAPGQGWLLEASTSWLDAEYDEIDTGITLIGKGFDFERVPEFTASLGISKEMSLGSNGTLVSRVDWSYRDESYNDAYNTPILETDDYELVNASVRWRNADDDLSVILSGRNLGDEEYMISGVYGTAFQSYEAMFDRGRQWSLEIRIDL
ncbi:MAG: TonB-dependent receptor [Gammaproteobacteria bacterium]|jgi:iron complex outermembrane receptor protein|nr:TonB-dependent receptor [Gammaproteobacteria bacterium]HJN97015.1 TonB-dependent receptor [Gammaproteobacteria bacterium]